MFKQLLVAASAVLCAAPAFAQPPEVELEGPVSSFDNITRTLVVMGMQVFIPDSANIHSPAATRAETRMTQNAFLRGLALPGRTAAGFMNGTAIVIGTWDEATGRVVADDVNIEPGESVSLGVITSSFCTTDNCDGPLDYLRGNSKLGGGPGPAMLPIKDIRMPASDVGDEGGFALSLAGQSLNGLGYVAEGYYGSNAVLAGSSAGAVLERSFHYFLFNLTAPAPQLIKNKASRELTVARAQCRVAKDFEVRGSNHTRLSETGGIRSDETLTPASGVIEVQYSINGVVNRANNAVSVPTGVGSAIGGYRVRFNIAGACPDTINVRWLATPGSNNTLAYANVIGAPVDIRLD